MKWCLGLLFPKYLILTKGLAFLGILVGTLLCVGCRQQHSVSERGNHMFELDDFVNIELSGSDTILTSPESDFLGIVKEIRVVNDSIIAISQARSDKNVILYNLNSGQSQVANYRGLGPFEINNVGSISVDSCGRLIMAGMFDGKLISATWNDSCGSNALIELLPSPKEDCMKIIAYTKSGYLGLSTPPHRRRILLLDSDGQIVDSLGSFPSVELPDSVYPTNFQFQSDFAFSPTHNKVVIVNKSWNEIGIYSIEESRDELSLSGPVFPELKMKQFGMPGAMGQSPSPLWFLFSGVCATDKACAIGYIGVEVKKDADFDRQINSILEFDWDGKPMRRFLLPHEAYAFDIDFSNNVIYSIENRPDPTLVKYVISH